MRDDQYVLFPEGDAPAPDVVAALLVLDRVPTERVPWWAAAWLAEGYDGENVRTLAGEHGDDVYKIKDLLPAALDEMDVSLPADAVAAANEVFSYLARGCLAGALSERDVAAFVDRIVAAGGFEVALYDLPLGGIYGLEDEWEAAWGRTEDAMREAVREACQRQVAAGELVPLHAAAPALSCGVDDEPPARSGLVNALWGGGIKYGPVDAVARTRMRRGLTIFTLVTAVAAGLVVGFLASARWGVAAAAIAAVALGGTALATLRDYE